MLSASESVATFINSRQGAHELPEAASAFLIAAQLDEATAEQSAALSRELRLLLARVRDLSEVAQADGVDELRSRRDRRSA